MKRKLNRSTGRGDNIGWGAGRRGNKKGSTEDET